MNNKYIELIDMMNPTILIICEDQEDYNETVKWFIDSYEPLLTNRHCCEDTQVGYNKMMIDGFRDSGNIDKDYIRFFMENAQVNIAVKLSSMDYFSHLIFTEKCSGETIQLAKKNYRYAREYGRLMRESDDSRMTVRPMYGFELDPANNNTVYTIVTDGKPVRVVFEGATLASNNEKTCHGEVIDKALTSNFSTILKDQE